VVVDIDGSLLRHGKELIIVQPPSIAHSLVQLQLASQLSIPPVHRCHMPFAPGQQQFATVPCVVHAVGSHVRQLELKSLLGRFDTDALANLILSNFVRPFQLCLRLEESGIVLEQDFRILGLQRKAKE
jgi:hypothetical protein